MAFGGIDLHARILPAQLDVTDDVVQVPMAVDDRHGPCDAAPSPAPPQCRGRCQSWAAGVSKTITPVLLARNHRIAVRLAGPRASRPSTSQTPGFRWRCGLGRIGMRRRRRQWRSPTGGWRTMKSLPFIGEGGWDAERAKPGGGANSKPTDVRSFFTLHPHPSRLRLDTLPIKGRDGLMGARLFIARFGLPPIEGARQLNRLEFPPHDRPLRRRRLSATPLSM